jgi:hypothetical protein
VKILKLLDTKIKIDESEHEDEEDKSSEDKEEKKEEMKIKIRELEKRPHQAKKPTIEDVIVLLQNQPNDTGQYYYLVSPEKSGPYDLQPLLELEDHDNLNKYNKFYTLSKKGIATYINDEPTEFITLNDWVHDKENYNKIRKKTFFK